MVRVGGGWDTLDHFLLEHDPCRIKKIISGIFVFTCKYFDFAFHLIEVDTVFCFIDGDSHGIVVVGRKHHSTSD